MLLDLIDGIIVYFLKSPKIKLRIFELGKYALHLDTKDN